MSGAALYLSDIGYTLGEPTPVASVVGDREARDSLDILRQEGVESYRVSESTPAQLAAASCLPQTVAGLSGSAGVVYCTDSPPSMTLTDDMWDFLCQTGIPDRTAVVSGGSGCGNLGPGLAVARGLLMGGEHMDILLVTTDRVITGTRFVASGLTVLSDSAASCRVTAEPPERGFRVTGMASLVRAATRHHGQGLASARSLITAVGQLVPRAFRNSESSATESRHLLTGNYGVTPRSLLAMAAGLEPEAHYAPRVGELGHCFSADILISLADLDADGSLAHGDQLMLIASSPKAWSVVAVDYYRPA
ncbi:hypothetical protein ACIBG8_46645 [Nonomuraea sp. NPDC050556]|uniref:hypothetical protein n=1 Tax=Nonomuraea sp. NPDC050556 TaxID=3364369 RepID=UPI0037A90DC1